MVKRLLCQSMLVIMAVSAHAAPSQKPNLTVLADEALISPLATLTRHFATASNTPVMISVYRPGVERAIMQGLDAHVLLTTDHALVTRLAEQGLTDVTTSQPIAHSPIVLAIARDHPARPLLPSQLSLVAAILAAPRIPIGFTQNTKDCTAALATSDEFHATLPSRLNLHDSEDDMLAEATAKTSLALTAQYRVAGHKALAALAPTAGEICPPESLYAVVLASEAMEDARTFTHYLESKEAASLLTRAGFTSQ